MATFVIKYEIEVIVDAPIANQAVQKAKETFNKMDYSGFDFVHSMQMVDFYDKNQTKNCTDPKCTECEI